MEWLPVLSGVPQDPSYRTFAIILHIDDLHAVVP